MTPELLPCVEIEPAETAQASIIWLHGLGADGNDFVPIVPMLGLDPGLPVRFVFPHAPQIPVTINGGIVMRAWYDIREADLSNRHDENGVRSSAAHLRALIARENERGVPTERIVLAGFSQGGAVSLFEGLRHPDPLAGLLILSSYLVVADDLETERSEANRRVQIFQAHGEMDPVVPFGGGVAARDRLRELGYDVQWQSYPMLHQVCEEEIEAAGAWLRERLASGAPR